MNTYRITYREGLEGPKLVRVDCTQGNTLSRESSDYVFVRKNNTVVIVSKDAVGSIELIDENDQEAV